MEKGVLQDYHAATALEITAVRNMLPLHDDHAIMEFFKFPERVRILVQMLVAVPFERAYWPRLILSTICSMPYLCERKFPSLV